MTKQVVIRGERFKRLVAAITKFPTLGSFAGSEMVNMSCDSGVLTATAVGVVMSVVTAKATGSIDLVAINERVLGNFAGVVADGAKVVLSRSGNEISLRCRKRVMLAPLMPGTQLTQPSIEKIAAVKISADAAAHLRYLADIAYNDSSRQEVCCVMLSKRGLAYAMDQKAVAVLRVPVGVSGPVPLPLPLARLVEAGNRLYADDTVTALRVGEAIYSMPTLTAARKGFPFGKVKALEATIADVVAIVDGMALAQAIDDCVKCLGNLARTEAVCSVDIPENTAEAYAAISAANGGATFSTKAPLLQALIPFAYRVPLESLSRARPFMRGKLRMARSKYGDMFLQLDGCGWLMFPAQVDAKKKKVQ